MTNEKRTHSLATQNHLPISKEVRLEQTYLPCPAYCNLSSKPLAADTCTKIAMSTSMRSSQCTHIHCSEISRQHSSSSILTSSPLFQRMTGLIQICFKSPLYCEQYQHLISHDFISHWWNLMKVLWTSEFEQIAHLASPSWTAVLFLPQREVANPKSPSLKVPSSDS